MNAIDINMEDRAIASEIGECISALFDAQARQRIMDAWLDGKIGGDHALELLLDLDLIEASDG